MTFIALLPLLAACSEMQTDNYWATQSMISVASELGLWSFPLRSIGLTVFVASVSPATALTSWASSIFGLSLNGRRNSGGVFLLIYLLVMILLILNIFIVIINEYLDQTKSHPETWGSEPEVMEHFTKLVSNLVGGTSEIPDARGEH